MHHMGPHMDLTTAQLNLHVYPRFYECLVFFQGVERGKMITTWVTIIHIYIMKLEKKQVIIIISYTYFRIHRATSTRIHLQINYDHSL